MTLTTCNSWLNCKNISLPVRGIYYLMTVVIFVYGGMKMLSFFSHLITEEMSENVSDISAIREDLHIQNVKN